MRFLYLIWTELWGRRERAGAGDGRTGASEVPVELEKPLNIRGRRDADRNKVGKPVS